ncbi:MAG TPA: DUF45 domain-containing protein [Candidatus Egerieicola pullicola]|uniref:DUF45 domain-containing protein n=1 Tax=Candidatus Egerieicola pullicola TaxID=2840775 RepID=A0A9D1AJT1_9FIRM|nr:DUF45 domain-containing protein [Candidatus Egerieicola pullicola]
MSPKQYGKPQQKTIVLLGERVGYTLTRKSVKNLNLRINREGQVSLSIPRWVSQTQAEEFLQAKAEFILAGRKRAAQRQDLHPRELPTQQGSRVFLWGKPCLLEFGMQGGEEPEILRLPDPDTAEKTLQDFYRTQCRAKAESFLPQVLADFGDALSGLPTLRYRRMTSRWGSCNVKTRQITLNTRLAEYQETALLAVLYHEVTHLLCPDHSQKFYRELLRRCPRYREWTEVLK